MTRLPVLAATAVAALALVGPATAEPFGQHVAMCAHQLGARANTPEVTCTHDGMTMAFAFEQDGGGIPAARALIDAGVFVVWAGNDTRVVQFKPPLVLDDAEADEIVGIVRGVLGG